MREKNPSRQQHIFNLRQKLASLQILVAKQNAYIDFLLPKGLYYHINCFILLFHISCYMVLNKDKKTEIHNKMMTLKITQNKTRIYRLKGKNNFFNVKQDNAIKAGSMMSL